MSVNPDLRYYNTDRTPEHLNNHHVQYWTLNNYFRKHDEACLVKFLLEPCKTVKNVEFLNSFTYKWTSLHTKSFDILFSSIQNLWQHCLVHTHTHTHSHTHTHTHTHTHSHTLTHTHTHTHSHTHTHIPWTILLQGIPSWTSRHATAAYAGT